MIYVLPSGPLAKSQGLTPLEHAPADSTTFREHGKQIAKILRKIKASKPEQAETKFVFEPILETTQELLRKMTPN